MTEPKLCWIEDELAALQEQGLLINLRTIESPAGAWMVVDGKRVLNMCTNNYLGLANDSRLVQAAKAALDRYGAGPTAVRSIAGTLSLHRELEQAMAEFKNVEDALYVQAGFLANQAALPPLVGPEDVIFSDRLNHASIIDGARLSRAKIIVYEHNDPADLEAKIKEHLPQYRRGLMVTDGVFSMDGDLAPLDQLYEVCERYAVLTMVDDAHGEGVVGRGGRGIVDHFGLHGKFDVEIGTFSKAFGVVGGIIAGKKLIIDYIRQKARPFLFSSAVTPADTAACLAAVRALSESTELVDRLWQNTRYFKGEMKALGFDTGQSVTPITPVMLGDVKLAKEFSRQLFERGIFAMALGFPTVPKGLARIRVMVSAALSREDLDFGLEQFKAVGRGLGVIG
ncbi:MAG: putative pyridoxal phosphate-dependent acyltransferase [Chloroflexi bacterium ADurb.Bin360]|nr:MAG: putative pyridoxal phosphate-dependent acyltransferase [Chloroflexi bacterium ADurb.Bin360]